MLSNALQKEYHVEIYALAGFAIFFTFFILVSIHTFRMKKKEEQEISRLPLDDEEQNPDKEE